MEKIEKDYHNWKLEDALVDIDKLIMGHMSDKEVEVTVITGLGVISDSVKKYLAQVEPLVNISWFVPANNEGKIIITLETLEKI